MSSRPSLTSLRLTLACGLILPPVVGCRTFQRNASGDFISGPGALAIVGSYLFVTDHFTLRRIDLTTGRNSPVSLPESLQIFDLNSDGQGGLLLSDSSSIWRLTLPTGELQRVAGSRSYEIDPQDGRPALEVSLFPRGGLHSSSTGAAVFSARGFWTVGPDRTLRTAYRPPANFVGPGRLCLDYPSRVSPMDLAVAPDGALFVACWGEYAADERILRLDAESGEVSTVVGPGTRLTSDSASGSGQWRLKSPRGLSFDQQGGLAFIDSGSNSLMRLDLSTGHVDRLASGFTNAADVASDADGNLYISDYVARRVFKFDRRSRSLRTSARVGGTRSPGFQDGVFMPEEPAYAECDNGDRPGYLDITARTPDGQAWPLTSVHQIFRDNDAVGLTNAEGIVRLTIEESRVYTFVVVASGFKPQAFTYRLSRSCTAQLDVALEPLRFY